MAILCSAILFTLFLLLGWVLMYITQSYLYLSIMFIIYLLILKLFYREANCKALEFKDFVVTFIFVALSGFVMLYFDQKVNLLAYVYLYLVSFVSILLFADSIRYKSLM